MSWAEQCYCQIIRGGLLGWWPVLERWEGGWWQVQKLQEWWPSLNHFKYTVDHRHHEQHPRVQASFLREVKSLVAVIEEMGSPFMEKSGDLLVLDTRDILDPSVREALHTAGKLGETNYHKFVEERLIVANKPKPITDRIPWNKLALFSKPPAKSPSKQKMQVAAFKNDCNLFSQLYISCQTRSGNLDKFFTHENQAAPPSLSLGGKLLLVLRLTSLTVLNWRGKNQTHTPVVDAKFLDGAAMSLKQHGLSKNTQT